MEEKFGLVLLLLSTTAALMVATLALYLKLRKGEGQESPPEVAAKQERPAASIGVPSPGDGEFIGSASLVGWLISY
ncbi:hypothetical protein [Halomonas sp. NO4]|uniref:hypothetical protein n=1 Tax=Halomonas sp. NO4 TaxID=2484813 RepID=UPI0013D73B03|nr:hypothetical protein [Halomonas sp. NO4]